MKRGLREASIKAEERKRPRANPGDERDAVRPRAMQGCDVENNQSSAETSGNGNGDQPGSRGVQVEGHAVQASCRGRLATRL